MGNVSRPLIALLVATVAFFALWLVALKPSSNGGGTAAQPSVGGLQHAINAAKGVQKTVNGNTARQSAAESGNSATTPASSAPASAGTPAAAPATSAHGAAAHHRTAAHHKTTVHRSHAARRGQARARSHVVANPGLAPTPAARFAAAERGLAQHKVVALLFYNPAAPDDQAVRQELATIPTHGGEVVRLAIPVSELPSYTAVIAQTPVNFTPTLVIVDRHRLAVQVTGFADTYAITQLIDNSL
jgi:hypothetical protein